MKKRFRSAIHEPTVMIHHVKEIQFRFLAFIAVLIAGMIVGYVFYEPLFSFIKAPLNGPLHYTSPAGSFNFVIKICLLVGVMTALPMAVYQLIMFIQPALKEKLSRLRIYITTLFSLLLASIGAAFAFMVIIPLALRFFYKFQVDGLVPLISADDYLRFVVNLVITFVLIFQLPLFISFIDHIKPLRPRTLLKAEKYIIVGSVAIGVLVPFAFDPAVQLLIASPIIILYNISIGIVLLQRYFRKRAERRRVPVTDVTPAQEAVTAVPAVLTPVAVPMASSRTTSDFRQRVTMHDVSGRRRSLSRVVEPSKPHVVKQPLSYASQVRAASRPVRTSSPRLISDVRSRPSLPTDSRMRLSAASPRHFPAPQAAE